LVLAGSKEWSVPQEQERKQAEKREADHRADVEQAEAASKGEKLKEEMDDILDEIDSVLEENAEEFIKSYVQKGGE